MSDLYKEETVCLRGMQKCCRIDEICQNIVHQANYVNHNKGQLNLTANKLCTVGSKQSIFKPNYDATAYKKMVLLLQQLALGRAEMLQRNKRHTERICQILWWLLKMHHLCVQIQEDLLLCSSESQNRNGTQDTAWGVIEYYLHVSTTKIFYSELDF